MKGTILFYSENENKGQISGHDGQRYSFVRMDFLKEGTIKEGMEVDFVVEDGIAKEIYVSGSSAEDKAGCNLIGVCVFFPVVGFVLYFIWKNTEPKKAKAVGLASLISFVAGILVYFIIVIFAVAANM